MCQYKWQILCWGLDEPLWLTSPPLPCFSQRLFIFLHLNFVSFFVSQLWLVWGSWLTPVHGSWSNWLCYWKHVCGLDFWWGHFEYSFDAHGKWLLTCLSKYIPDKFKFDYTKWTLLCITFIPNFSSFANISSFIARCSWKILPIVCKISSRYI